MRCDVSLGDRVGMHPTYISNIHCPPGYGKRRGHVVNIDAAHGSTVCLIHWKDGTYSKVLSCNLIRREK